MVSNNLHENGKKVNVLKAFIFIHGLLIIIIILSVIKSKKISGWGGYAGLYQTNFHKITNMPPPPPVVLLIHLGCFVVRCHCLRIPSVETPAFSLLSWHLDGAHPLMLKATKEERLDSTVSFWRRLLKLIQACSCTRS